MNSSIPCMHVSSPRGSLICDMEQSSLQTNPFCYEPQTVRSLYPGPALADAGPNARPRHGAPLSSDFITSSCSVNRVTVMVERRYAVQH